MTRNEIRIFSVSSAVAFFRKVLSRSQVDHVARAPDVCGDRAGRRGGQEDRVVVLDRIAARMHQLALNAIAINRHHQSKPAQAAIQLLRSRSEWSNLISQDEPDFRTLVAEVFDQR